MGLVLVVLFFLVGGLPLATTAAVATGSASSSAPATTPASTALTITVWPRGPNRRSVRWTLRCAPAGGSLPRPAQACRRLLALRAPFAPVPSNTACTAIYGGPQVARVRGTFRGRRIDTVFDRKDGCEIARWNRVRFLLRA